MKIDFFGGWTEGWKSGKNLYCKIFLTLRIVKNSFRGLWLWVIKPKLTGRI